MKIKFVTVSKDENFSMIAIDFKYIIDNNIGVLVEIANNKDSLAMVYNRCIEESLKSNEDLDYIVFMHSDIKFNVEDFIKHLESISGKYDLLGLCGCSKIVASQSPLNWFCGSIPCPEDRWGCVTHGQRSNMTSFFSKHHPDVLDHEVACIDGLCIVLSRKAIDSGLRFDESLGKFDFYDTDISFQAMIKYKLKIGVMVQKDLYHYSVGESILSEKFLVEELRFRQKWNLPIPDKIKQLVKSSTF